MRALETQLAPALEHTGLDQLRVGLSGGADSLALLAGLEWATRHRRGPLAGVALEARIVDHGLQDGSGEVARAACSQAETLGVPAEVVVVDVDLSGHEGAEAAARSARYRALFDGTNALVVVGHTLDDQGETVLLGLARGSGVRSLAGMAALSARAWGDDVRWLARPLLSVQRTDTEKACRDWGLTWWDDPMNTDTVYTRSAVRAAMPLLVDVLGPGFAQGLSRTATLARQDADYLDELAEASGISDSQESLPVADLAALPPALRTRVILRWLRQRSLLSFSLESLPDSLLEGDDQSVLTRRIESWLRARANRVTFDHVMAVDSLLTDWHGQKGINTPGGLVRRVDGSLVFDPVGAKV